MVAVSVFIAPRDAKPFHKAGNEVCVALAVLHGVFQLRVAVGQIDPVMRTAQISIGAQHVFDDLDHGLVVENLVVPAQPRDVHPRAQDQMVMRAPIGNPAIGRLADNPVVVTLALGHLDLDRGMSAQQFVQINCPVIRQRLDPPFKGARQGFNPVHAQHDQRIAAQGGAQARPAIALTERRIHSGCSAKQ